MDRISRHSLGEESVPFKDFSESLSAFCWWCGSGLLHQTMTWGSSQLSVKRLGWKSGPPSLRPQISLLELSLCPKWRSLNFSGSCWWGRVEWSGSLTGRWCSISSNVDTSLNCCNEEGADLEGKALSLTVSQCSSFHLWSWSLGRDWKHKNVNTWSKERIQWRWFGHLIRMLTGGLLLEVTSMSLLEIPGQTQNTVERLNISFGPGTSQDPPVGDENCAWGDGHKDYLTELTASSWLIN